VGSDSFAFLEVVRSLEEGAVVALLVDRPPAPTNVRVTLFGRAFDTSMAAAELARATGCALVPGYIVWEEGRYIARLFPELPYDRASLRQRENRVKLSQDIMNCFEPVIARYPEQWFHFVPVWRAEEPPNNGS
jgi:lauroyl/myristoyl acyltransferase